MEEWNSCHFDPFDRLRVNSGRNPMRSIVPNRERDLSFSSRSFALLRMTRRGEADFSSRFLRGTRNDIVADP